MKELCINDYTDLCKAVLKESDNGDLSVVIIGDSETIIDSLNYLIKNTNSYFAGWNITTDEVCQPCYLQFTKREIWCGNAEYDDGSFFHFDEDIVFVMNDYLEKYLMEVGRCNIIVFEYDEETKDDGDCLCMDDDSCGFTFCSNGDGSHYTFRFRTNRKMTEEEAWQLALKYI